MGLSLGSFQGLRTAAEPRYCHLTMAYHLCGAKAINIMVIGTRHGTISSVENEKMLAISELKFKVTIFMSAQFQGQRLAPTSLAALTERQNLCPCV